MSSPHPLQQQAEDFAIELMETLAGVLPRGDLGLELISAEDSLSHELTTTESRGIVLDVDEHPSFRFEISYRLAADNEGRWLKVLQSSFSLVPDGKGAPFFRYDYDVDARGVPQAHLNVHGHRDDMIEALLGGKSPVFKARRQKYLREGRLPRLANFHFPVGGQRFRPCIEDVLEVAASELNIDVRKEYRTALQRGRTRYRTRQLKAAVRDSPAVAVEVLQSLGYEVDPPVSIAPQRDDWLCRI